MTKVGTWPCPAAVSVSAGSTEVGKSPEPPLGQGSVVKGSVICSLVGDKVPVLSWGSSLYRSQRLPWLQRAFQALRKYLSRALSLRKSCAMEIHTGWISSALQGCRVCCPEHVSSACETAQSLLLQISGGKNCHRQKNGTWAHCWAGNPAKFPWNSPQIPRGMR